jgi:hypothetical protein
MTRILIVDPLTLLGRELLRVLQLDAELSRSVAYGHTDLDDEHQISELAGDPALVPPIEGPADFESAELLLVASTQANPRLKHLVRFMDDHPATPTVVVGRSAGLWEQTRPATGAALSWDSLHVRVAHPALIALSTILEALGDFEPVWASVAAVEPVSSLGQEEIARMARQAAQRLSGAPVEELIDDHILAFNLVGVETDDLVHEAAILMPNIELVVTRTASGCFHGHTAHIGVGFRAPVDRNEVLDSLSRNPLIAEPDLPLTLDSRTDTDQVGLTPPVLSSGGRVLAVTAMVDGLRIGGAVTALEILRSMI